MKTLVLVGAGHAHVVALHHWFRSPLKDIQIILISDVEYAPYSGMVPGYLAGFYQHHEIVFDLKALSAQYKIKLIISAVTSIDDKLNQLKLANGETVIYDCLSLNIGILPEKINSEDYANVIYVKPLSHLIPKWINFTRSKEVNQVMVVGAGAAGFEAAAGERVFRLSGGDAEFQAGGGIPGFPGGGACGFSVIGHCRIRRGRPDMRWMHGRRVALPQPHGAGSPMFCPSAT